MTHNIFLFRARQFLFLKCVKQNPPDLYPESVCSPDVFFSSALRDFTHATHLPRYLPISRGPSAKNANIHSVTIARLSEQSVQSKKEALWFLVAMAST